MEESALSLPNDAQARVFSLVLSTKITQEKKAAMLLAKKKLRTRPRAPKVAATKAARKPLAERSCRTLHQIPPPSLPVEEVDGGNHSGSTRRALEKSPNFGKHSWDSEGVLEGLRHSATL